MIIKDFINKIIMRLQKITSKISYKITSKIFYKTNSKISCKNTSKMLSKSFLTVFLISVLTSCSTTKKDIQKEYIYDTINHTEYIEKLKYDSIYLKDSIYVYSKNDTIFQNIYKYLYKYKYIKDTIHNADTVKVYQTQYKEKVIESASAKFKNRLSGVLLGIIVSAVIIIAYKFKDKLKKL